MVIPYSQPNVINIFTDASTDSNGEFVCPGYVAVQNDLVLSTDYVVLKGETAQFGELYAIMMGLTFMNQNVWMKRYSGRDLELCGTIYNLLSDSLYSIDILKRYLPRFINTTNEAVRRAKHPTYDNNPYAPPDLIKKFGSKDTVKNQEVMLHCMGLITSTQFPVYIYHIKGHLSNSDSGIDEGIQKFQHINSANVSVSDMRSMIQWNNVVDRNSRQHLKTILAYNRNLPNEVQWPVLFYPNQYQQSIYKNFIR